MVALTTQWLPVLLSAIAVFAVSSLVHMAFRYHSNDYRKLAAEDEVMRALAPHAIPPGEYMFPYSVGMDSMKDPAFVEKRTRGPAGILNVFPPGMPGMGALLGKWFVFNALVSLFAAYLTSRALPAGADGAEVFRFTMTIGFVAYGIGSISESIWLGRAWSTTMKNLFDAVLYGAAMGAVFVWLWPG